MQVGRYRATKIVTNVASALLMLAPAVYAQVKPRITQAVDQTQRKILAGTVHPLAKTASDQGRAQADLPMKDMLLTLHPSTDQAAVLKRLVEDLHNPNSPNFYKWITPAQYTT